MKKLILVVVMAIGLVQFANATHLDQRSSDNVVPVMEFGECDDVYVAVRNAYFVITGDLTGAILAGIRAEEVCLERQEEILEQPR